MARRRARVPSTYVVQRQAVHPWEWSAEVTLSIREDDKYASFVPLCGLPTEALAEARRQKLEAEARRTMAIGPFLRNLPTEKAGDIISAAIAAGLPPPDLSEVGPAVEPQRIEYGGGLVGTRYGGDYFAWSRRVEGAILAWWQARATEITPEQNAALWDALFPEHRFFTVQRVLLEE
jgi:hypothetical protein